MGERVTYYVWRNALYTSSGRTATKTEERGGLPNHSSRDHAAVPWVSFHSFRHTCASILFSSGKNIKQVAAWLGHSDPGFTLRTYVHLMDAGIGDASCMDALYSPTVATEKQQPTAKLPEAAAIVAAAKPMASSENDV